MLQFWTHCVGTLLSMPQVACLNLWLSLPLNVECSNFGCAAVKAVGIFRFDYQYEIENEYEFSISVCQHYIFKSHTDLILGATFCTGKQPEGVRALKTSQV